MAKYHFIVAIALTGGLSIASTASAQVQLPRSAAVPNAQPTFPIDPATGLPLAGGGVTAPATTPAVGTASTVTTGGTAVTMVTGPVKGCTITNGPTVADEGSIAAVENAYVNAVTTATTTAFGTTEAIQPGQTWHCVPGQTTNVSVNAATNGHKLAVYKW